MFYLIYYSYITSFRCLGASLYSTLVTPPGASPWSSPCGPRASRSPKLWLTATETVPPRRQGLHRRPRRLQANEWMRIMMETDDQSDLRLFLGVKHVAVLLITKLVVIFSWNLRPGLTFIFFLYFLLRSWQDSLDSVVFVNQTCPKKGYICVQLQDGFKRSCCEVALRMLKELRTRCKGWDRGGLMVHWFVALEKQYVWLVWLSIWGALHARYHLSSLPSRS